LVQTQAIGICGTDVEIINGEYGSAPPGEDRLIMTVLVFPDASV
jgi:threonine dehydrogenase-like Zn-dependent dehydrogenase